MEPFRSFITFAKTDSNVSATAITPTPLDEANELSQHPVQNEDVNCQQYRESLPIQNIEDIPAETPRAFNLKRKRPGTPKDQQPSPQQQSGVDKVISYLQERNSNLYQDDLDKTFLGYAATARKLSAQRQAILKYEVAKLLMHAEKKLWRIHVRPRWIRQIVLLLHLSLETYIHLLRLTLLSHWNKHLLQVHGMKVSVGHSCF